jgi:hypothetical protein
MNNWKRVWLAPLILILLAVLVAGALGVKVACAACDVSGERRMREMAKAQASSDYKCLKPRIISGTQNTGIYALDVCGKRRWYKCKSVNCDPRCKNTEASGQTP